MLGLAFRGIATSGGQPGGTSEADGILYPRRLAQFGNQCEDVAQVELQVGVDHLDAWRSRTRRGRIRAGLQKQDS